MSFASKDIEKQYYALQTAIADEMITSYYGMYTTDKYYPFVEIDKTESSTKTVKSAHLTDKHLKKVESKDFAFDIEYRELRQHALLIPYDIRDQIGDALYLRVEKDGSTYYAVFAQQPYCLEFVNIIKRATYKECDGSETTVTDDGYKITFCFDHYYNSCDVPFIGFYTNGICCDENGNPIGKLKLRKYDEQRFYELQEQLCKAVVDMRSNSVDVYIDPIISNV